MILAGSLPLESRRCVENFSVSVIWAGWRFGTPYAKNWRHFQLLATQFLGFLPPNHGVVRGYKSLPGHFRVSGRSSKKNLSSSSSCRKSLNSANSRSCNFFLTNRGTLKWFASSGFRTHQHHQLHQQTIASSGKKNTTKNCSHWAQPFGAHQIAVVKMHRCYAQIEMPQTQDGFIYGVSCCQVVWSMMQ